MMTMVQQFVAQHNKTYYDKAQVTNLQMVVLDQSHGLWCGCEQILHFSGFRLCGCSCRTLAAFCGFTIFLELLQDFLDGSPVLIGFSGILLLLADEEDQP